MKVFIQGTGSISPQGTHEQQELLNDPRVFSEPLLRSEEPVYKEFIPPREVRRMSRVVKMGIAAARMSLDEAGAETPEAIVTGTGLGVMEETEHFLLAMLDENEQLLNPSPFIRSTHNSIGGQLAISLGCKGYNHTYVHRGLSFASALMDGHMLLREGTVPNVLVGGFEEITDNHFHITKKLGNWKDGPFQNLELLNSNSEGSIAGEGAQFFFLSGEKNDGTLATLEGVDLFYDPQGEEELSEWVRNFLEEQNMKPEDLDAVIYGYSGDKESDSLYNRIRQKLFPEAAPLYYKHLSGEFHTADSFGLWLGARILHDQKVPEVVKMREEEVRPPRNLLLYDHFFGKEHTLYLLTG